MTSVNKEDLKIIIEEQMLEHNIIDIYTAFIVGDLKENNMSNQYIFGTTTSETTSRAHLTIDLAAPPAPRPHHSLCRRSLNLSQGRCYSSRRHRVLTPCPVLNRVGDLTFCPRRLLSSTQPPTPSLPPPCLCPRALLASTKPSRPELPASLPWWRRSMPSRRRRHEPNPLPLLRTAPLPATTKITICHVTALCPRRRLSSEATLLSLSRSFFSRRRSFAAAGSLSALLVAGDPIFLCSSSRWRPLQPTSLPDRIHLSL
ncbi:hypothetical protein M0R45_006667 [Rubus argutus]|uniref:Uncharacterized protein n=1 Tax=Rubus argutus TaxID=59490 RepID=A0AAW1YR65_RUBAR